jgi:mitochondrial fission protein ELM1
MDALRANPPPADEVAPRVWLLKGPKLGDYTQIRALAAAIGWPAETKTLAFHRAELLLHLVDAPTRLGLDRRKSDSLAPPWPDLVLTAGRRNELVARWIRERSEGRTKLVHVGRPWSRPGTFDLVVTTPQYELAPAPGVVVNELPLHDITSDALARARDEWQHVLGADPRPRLAVLVGGDSGPFVFTAALANELAWRVNALAERDGASVWLTTSGRTPQRFVDALLPALRTTRSYVWSAERGSPSPYRGYLAHADAFVVTSDSVSMVAEAVATGKPVWLFNVADRRHDKWLHLDSYRWKPLTHALAQRFAPDRFRRDVDRIHRRLVEAGHAAWLSSAAFVPPATAPRATEDLERSAAAVRALMGR